MSAGSYAAREGSVTTEGIMRWLGCSAEDAESILYMCERGYLHGLRGWYRDGDYSSDADWCYGVGARIRELEDALDIDDGEVFEYYRRAHDAGLVDGGYLADDGGQLADEDG